MTLQAPFLFFNALYIYHGKYVDFRIRIDNCKTQRL
jgi:hypothetical protein